MSDDAASGPPDPQYMRERASVLFPKPCEPEDLPDINEAQSVFVEQFMVDLNATRAYRIAYPACKSNAAARVGGCEMKKDADVGLHIRYALWERSQRTLVDADDIVRELAIVAKSNIANYQVDDDGWVEVRPGVPPEAMKAVAGIERTVSYDKEGNKRVTVKFRLHPKMEATRQIGEHLGMFLKRLANPDGSKLDLGAVRELLASGDD
jgi:phage terminase small subunit